MNTLVEVAPGVLVARHSFAATTSTVVLGAGDGALVVDPGVDVSEIRSLATQLKDIGRTARIGFATHAHWDHLLWHPQLGSPPRYASAATVHRAGLDHRRNAAEAARSGVNVDTGSTTPLLVLPHPTAPLPWDGPTVLPLIHDAHAPGHTALLLADRGVLIAGDMLSDVEVPLLDLDADDPIGDYHAALDLLAGHVDDIRVLIPGHGSVADTAQLRQRLDLDRRYLDDLSQNRRSHDPRLVDAPDWLTAEHTRAISQVHRISRTSPTPTHVQHSRPFTS